MTPASDIVVIGAGIHGAGVAQAAAAAGYSVLLLEQSGVAAGTSSRSSKLIHGGLRYLESAQLGLVRECLQERDLLLKLAPDLVKLLPFYIPVYRSSRRRPWQIRLGLGLYSLLAYAKSGAGFHRVPASHWEQLEGLNTSGLEQVFAYQDAQTNDRLLTEAVTRSACSLGAKLLMPARFIGATLNTSGAVVRFTQNGHEHECHARMLVNAAGPWVTGVLETITPSPPVCQVELVKGTHLELAARAKSAVYYLESPDDGRAVFVMPWQGRTLVGTTEAAFSGLPEKVMPDKSETDYLCRVVERYFPGIRTKGQGMITNSFAGLRVLPKNSKPFSIRSREILLQADRHRHPRLITIYGGKLTSYRADALKVMRIAKSGLPPARIRADTAKLPLTLP